MGRDVLLLASVKSGIKTRLRKGAKKGKKAREGNLFWQGIHFASGAAATSFA